MLVVNPLAAAYYLLPGSTLGQALPSSAPWVIPLFGVLCLANFCWALAVWRWKKWGAYGFAASALVAFLVNLTSTGLLAALFGLLGLVTFALLVRPVWRHMR